MKAGQQKNRDNFQPLSSVFFQSMLYFDEVYTVMFFILEGLIFFYKGFQLYYPSETIGEEVAILILFAFCQIARLQMGSAGNKTESSSHVGWFLLIELFVICGFVYFLVLQSYVLMFEVVINSLGLAFAVLEFFFGILSYCNFKSFERQQY